MTYQTRGTDRLAYIDWMRGLACLLMFQTHCYDSWLSPEARKSPVLIWSQLGGTFPAPLFIFLAGISFALAFGYAPWTDLFRVDVLNILGLSMILMGILCFFISGQSPTSARNRTIA